MHRPRQRADAVTHAGLRDLRPQLDHRQRDVHQPRQRQADGAAATRHQRPVAVRLPGIVLAGVAVARGTSLARDASFESRADLNYHARSLHRDELAGEIGNSRISRHNRAFPEYGSPDLPAGVPPGGDGDSACAEGAPLRSDGLHVASVAHLPTPRCRLGSPGMLMRTAHSPRVSRRPSEPPRADGRSIGRASTVAATAFWLARYGRCNTIA
jgi:hypothetical protein